MMLLCTTDNENACSMEHVIRLILCQIVMENAAVSRFRQYLRINTISNRDTPCENYGEKQGGLADTLCTLSIHSRGCGVLAIASHRIRPAQQSGGDSTRLLRPDCHVEGRQTRPQVRNAQFAYGRRSGFPRVLGARSI